MSAALFLDRDGTIIKDVGDVKYITHVKFYDFTFEALQKAQKFFKLFIITNQPGISKNILTHNDVVSVHDFIKNELSMNKITIEEIYYCPHAKEDNCQCRKPNTFFIDEAVAKHKINVNNSFVIGDHPSDVMLAKRCGMQGIYVLTGHGRKHRNEVDNVIVKRNLYYAVDYILKSVQV